jgi:hypothetical protein
MKRNLLTAATLAATIVAGPAFAGTIANWKEFNGAATPATSGMNTDSPTIGDGTADNADDAWIGGLFGTVGSPESVTLAVGETLIVSGSVVLTGGVTSPNNFRFGVADDGGQFAVDNMTWSNGGWIYRADNTIYQGRTDNVFVSTNPNAVLLASTGTDTGGAFTGDSTAAYDWSFSVTRDSATTVDIFASVTGGDNAVNKTATVNDQTTSLFTYSAAGILLGGALNVDQASFSNVQYNVIPEPSSLALLGLGGLLIARRRRG